MQPSENLQPKDEPDLSGSPFDQDSFQKAHLNSGYVEVRDLDPITDSMVQQFLGGRGKLALLKARLVSASKSALRPNNDLCLIADAPFESVTFNRAKRSYVPDEPSYRSLYVGSLHTDHPLHADYLQQAKQVLSHAFMAESWVLFALGADPKKLSTPDGYHEEHQRISQDPELRSKARSLLSALLDWQCHHGGKLFVASTKNLNLDVLKTDFDTSSPTIVAAMTLTAARKYSEHEEMLALAEYVQNLYLPARDGAFGKNGETVIRSRAIISIYSHITNYTAGLLGVDDQRLGKGDLSTGGSGVGLDLLRYSLSRAFSASPSCKFFAGAASQWLDMHGSVIDRTEMYRGAGVTIGRKVDFLGLPIWMLSFEREVFGKFSK